MMVKLIMTGASFVAIASMISRGMGLLKELYVAYLFGLTEDLSGYILAFSIVMYLSGAIGGALGASFMPNYIGLKLDGEKSKFIRAVLSKVGRWLFAFTIFVAATALVVSFADTGSRDVATCLTILIPLVLINGITRIYASALYAIKVNGVVEIIPTITSLFVVVILYAGHSLRFISTELLAWAVLLGSVAEFWVIYLLTKKSGVLVLTTDTLDFKRLGPFRDAFFAMLLSGLLMGSTTVIDYAMASYVEVGNAAQLSYGTKVTSFILTIFIAALGISVLPVFSKIVTGDGITMLNSVAYRLSGIVFTVGIVISIVLYASSAWVVRFLFDDGYFAEDEIRMIVDVYRMSVLQIPFYALSIMTVRLVTAIGKTNILVWGSALNLPLNIGLNFLFIETYGLSGIALSTTFVYLFSFLFLSVGYIWVVKGLAK